jgi:hypothetical protein
MPTINVEPKDYGYTPYKNRDLAPGTTVDLTGSTFLTQQLPTFRNAYPVNVGGGPGCSVVGARVLGTTKPDDASWGARYKKLEGGGRQNCAAVVATGSDDFTYSRLRIHDCWDAIRVEGQMPLKWRIEHCWISRNHDDAIESDNSVKQNGLLFDTLVDGSYVLLSAAGGTKPGHIRIEKALMRLQPFPGAHNEGAKLQPGHMAPFKVGKERSIDLIDTIICISQKSNKPDRLSGIPTMKDDGSLEWLLGECRNTVLVWTGPGDYPYKLDRRIEIVRDIKVWEAAKADWIARHPDVPRFDFDPVLRPPPAPTGYQIMRAPTSIAIDADLSDYANAMPLYVETRRATLEARVMWSPAGLHFGLRVTDPEVVADTLSDRPWRQASVEIFIDPTGDGGGAMSGDDTQIIITPQGRVLPAAMATLPSAVALTADGYMIEALVPWHDRERCRLNFALNDGTESAMLGGDRKDFLVPDKWMVAKVA